MPYLWIIITKLESKKYLRSNGSKTVRQRGNLTRGIQGRISKSTFAPKIEVQWRLLLKDGGLNTHICLCFLLKHHSTTENEFLEDKATKAEKMRGRF